MADSASNSCATGIRDSAVHSKLPGIWDMNSTEELLRLEHKYRALSRKHFERGEEYKELADECIKELMKEDKEVHDK